MKNLLRRLIPRTLRNATRRPDRTLAGVLDELSFRLGRVATCHPGDGWEVKCHPASRRPFDLQAQDDELRAELRAFVGRCTEGMVFFDVGAHHGIFTLAALRHGRGSRVVALEPSSNAARILRINVALAGGADRVNVQEAAAGAIDGAVSMLTTGSNADHYMVGTDEVRPDATRMRQVTLMTLATELGLSPTHVKIDVEGFEGEVIEGAAPLLERSRPTIFLELHGDFLRARERSPRGVLSKLESLGYSRFLRDQTAIAPEEAANARLVRLVCEPARA